MNESIKNMIERRSVRGYKPDMIPKEDLDLILEAGTYAATGMGMQSPVIVALDFSPMESVMAQSG